MKYPINLAAIAVTSTHVPDTAMRKLTGIGLFKLTIDKKGATHSEISTITNLANDDDAKDWLAQKIDTPSHVFTCDEHVDILPLRGLESGTSCVVLDADDKLAIRYARDNQWISHFALRPSQRSSESIRSISLPRGRSPLWQMSRSIMPYCVSMRLPPHLSGSRSCRVISRWMRQAPKP